MQNRRVEMIWERKEKGLFGDRGKDINRGKRKAMTIRRR